MKAPLLAISLLLASSPALAQLPPASSCGSLQNHYGPFDYRTRKDKLQRVEDYHFNLTVQSLTGGQSTTRIGPDLNYLLNTSPNHHRGLDAMMRLAKKTGSDHPPNVRYSIDCLFERALRFQPDDVVARLLYVQWLIYKKRPQDGMKQTELAIRHAGDIGSLHMNIGMTFLDLGDMERALAQAHRAIALGHPSDTLIARLKKEGAWREPDAEPVPGTPVAPASAAASR